MLLRLLQTEILWLFCFLYCGDFTATAIFELKLLDKSGCGDRRRRNGDTVLILSLIEVKGIAREA